MRRSWYWVDMLICILSSSHYFIAKSKASFFVFAFKICLRHQSVTPFLGGASAPPRKILNWPTYIFSKELWSRLATIVHLANDLSLFAMKLEKLLLNYKTTASCQANMSSKASFQTFQTTKLNLEKLLG